ncbi:MAG: ATP-binding protein, partial [Chloroflexota bacterium]
IDQKPKSLLGQSVRMVISQDEEMMLIEKMGATRDFPPFEFSKTVRTPRLTQDFRVFVHLNDDFLLLEFEPDDGSTPDDFLNSTHENLAAIRNSPTVIEACQVAAEAVRSISQQDRVMVYRFDQADYHGVVVAEDIAEDVDSFLGLHYPASDIPKMARELFVQNGLRIITDIDHEPANLLAMNADLPPLDLSGALLRGVSPGHIRYLHNMGVQGSMSIAIIKNNQLWGIFACHALEPNFVPRYRRDLCRFMGMIFSAQISALEDRDFYAELQSKQKEKEALLKQLSDADNLLVTLQNNMARMQRVIEADGFAYIFDGNITSYGTTPNDTQIATLAEWLYAEQNNDTVFHTHILPILYPAAKDYADTASGLVSVPLSATHPAYMLWFRQQYDQTITWGRQIEQLADSPPLTVDSSFSQWQQSVQYNARRWSESEIAVMRDFRTQLNEIRVQQALIQNERQMRAILDTLPSLVFVYRGDEILFINETAPILTGYTSDELRGGKLWDVIPQNTLRQKDKFSGLTEEELRINRKDGNARWIYLNALPITFEDQAAAVGTAFDITERKVAAQRAIEIQVERERIRILAEFIQDVSHDLRTPLAIIFSSIHLLKRQLDAEDNNNIRRLNVMERQASYLKNLIDNLTTMSRLDSKVTYNFQPTNINRVLLEMQATSENMASEKQQSIIFDLDMDAPIVRADPNELTRCFNNLITNAIRYSDPNTSIMVRSTIATNHLIVSVEDEGIGISDRDLPLIFDRFFRVNTSRTNADGSGLGLAITKKIIDMHNGKIEVESTLGE